MCNLRFLRFLTCRHELTQLARLQRSTLLDIPSVGQKYARIIQEWHETAGSAAVCAQ